MTVKPYSAPLPLAAIYDTRLAGLDLRVLACIAFHDRMSLATEKGQGCWASHATLAAEIGCNYINLGKAVKKLGDLGYLVRSRPTFGDKRGHVYRVPAALYAKQESESFGKRGKDETARSALGNVGQRTNPAGELVCHDTAENAVDSVTSSEQYISLSDVRYSAEAEEHTHHKVRIADATRVAASGAVTFREFEPLHETLAKFERGWRQDRSQFTDKIHQWADWLLDAAENNAGEDPTASGRAMRLFEEVSAWIDHIAWENGGGEL